MKQTADHDKGPLLGRQVSGSEHYDPSLLFPVPRANARGSLPGGRFDALGEDIWHAYELSWLNGAGMPQMYTGTLRIPASTPNLIESKSLKLYLNSLNNHRFADADAAARCIEADLSRVAGAGVSLTLHGVGDRDFDGIALDAELLDELQVLPCATPELELLRREEGSMRVCTHLLRSLCPVTAQPDWATVLVESRGAAAEREGLLAYLLAYRNHQEFHEQCVERIFTDLWNVLEPGFLTVQAFYTRRGGLDISPFRASGDVPAILSRLNRQ